MINSWRLRSERFSTTTFQIASVSYSIAKILRDSSTAAFLRATRREDEEQEARQWRSGKPLASRCDARRCEGHVH